MLSAGICGDDDDDEFNNEYDDEEEDDFGLGYLFVISELQTNTQVQSHLLLHHHTHY